MRKIFTTLIFLSLITYLLSPSVYAQVPQRWEDLPGGDRCVSQGDVATLQGFECIFTNIVRILTPVVGLLLFFMLIVGAFQYLTSAGDPKQVQKAGQTLTFAIIGLFLFFGIWFILQLIKVITGVDVTKFIIPG